MSDKLGPVDIEFVLKNVNFKKEGDRIKAEIRGISDTAKREVDETNKLLRSLGTGLLTYFTFQGAKGFTQELINVRGEFQQMGIAMETILGSKQKADALMAQVVDLAAKTPFTLTEVGQGAKQLLAFQESNETVIDTLTRLGNIASGISVPIGRLITVYGQVKAKGRLMGDDLRQFTEAGIPLIHELAKQFGVADTEIAKMVETGKIGFSDVQKVIMNLTNEGGMFFNLMEKQSKSLTGMVSNLQDAWDKMLNEIGKGNEEFLSGGIRGLTNLINNYDKVVSTLKVLAVTYGAYKAAVIATSIATNGLTIAENLHYATLVLVEKGHKLLKTTMLTNPYILATTAIIGLVSALILFRKRTDDITESQRRIIDINKRAGDSYIEEKSKIDLLLQTARNKGLSDRQRLEAITKLKEIIPGYNSELSKEGEIINENTIAIQNYLKQLELKIKLTAVQDELTALWKQEREQIREVAAAQEEYNKQKKISNQLAYGGSGTSGAGMGGNVVDSKILANAEKRLNDAKFNLELTKQIINDLKVEFNSANKSLSDFFNALAGSGGAITSARTVEVIEAEISALEAEQKKLSDTSAKWEEYNKKIATLVKERDSITGNKKEQKASDKLLSDEQKRLDDLLALTNTYNDKRLLLGFKYQVEKNKLEKAGHSDRVAALTEQYQKELDELQAANFEKDESYRWVYDNLENMGRKALQEYIARLKREIEAFKGNEEIKLELTKKLAEAEEKIAVYTPKKLREAATVLNEMAELAGIFNNELAESINQAANLATGIASAVEGFSTGNYAQGMAGSIQAVTSLIKLLSASERQKKKDQEATEKLSKWLDQMAASLDRLNNAFQSLKGDDKIKAYNILLAETAESLDEVDKKLRRYFQDFQNMSKVKFPSVKGMEDIAAKTYEQLTATDWERIIASSSGSMKKSMVELYNEWLKLKAQQEEYFKEQAEYITGTSFDGLVDEMVGALQDGERSVKDFADNAEALIKKAVIQGFKTKYLTQALEPWYKEFAKLGENGYTAEEIAQLKKAISKIMGDAGAAFDALGTLGIDLKGASDNANSLAGSISGITEETASILAGRLNSMHLTINEGLRVAQRGLLYQAEIAGNTARLYAIETSLKSIINTLARDTSQITIARGKGIK